jgi:hypothetical protein
MQAPPITQALPMAQATHANVPMGSSLLAILSGMTKLSSTNFDMV